MSSNGCQWRREGDVRKVKRKLIIMGHVNRCLRIIVNKSFWKSFYITFMRNRKKNKKLPFFLFFFSVKTFIK